ncbi:MAG: hypothetical protein ABIT37_02165 [Luteolibacter sp.]
MKTKRRLVIAACVILSGPAATAHTTYGGTARDLGPSAGSAPGVITGTAITPYFKALNNQTVTSNFGWAAGTDTDKLGNAHDIKAYRFTLAEAGLATITVSSAARGTGTQGFFPAFSLFSGLLHTASADYDSAAVTLDYLATLGGTQPKNGAFNALDTWRIGNDPGELSTLTYVGNAADGTSAIFGSAPGIHGDGLADGIVQQTFWLAAGDYSLIIGGANITGADLTGSYGIDASLSVVPEPSVALLAAFSSCALFMRRR